MTIEGGAVDRSIFLIDAGVLVVIPFLVPHAADDLRKNVLPFHDHERRGSFLGAKNLG
jgi:hypothetical protein